jgi:hypothetical protein
MQTPVAPLCNLIVKVVIAACQRIDVRFVQRRAERAERRALLPHALHALAVLVKDQMGDLSGLRHDELHLGVHHLHEELRLSMTLASTQLQTSSIRG